MSKCHWSGRVPPSVPAHSLAKRSPNAGVMLHNGNKVREAAQNRSVDPSLPQALCTDSSILLDPFIPFLLLKQQLLWWGCWCGVGRLWIHEWTVLSKASQFHSAYASKCMEMLKLEFSYSQFCCMRSVGWS